MTALPMTESFVQYFKCPPSLSPFRIWGEWDTTGTHPGYFRFGPESVCYGTFSKAVSHAGLKLADALEQMELDGDVVLLPFNPDEVASSLRYERYYCNNKTSSKKSIIRDVYYLLRPVFPVAFRRHLQRIWLKGWNKASFPRWPGDCNVDLMFKQMMHCALQLQPESEIPFIWFWPEGWSGCSIMTHDVETQAGLRYADTLMDINDSYGIKSSFQLIPDARYSVTPAILESIRKRGFEVNVHDLKHDGRLYENEVDFKKAAAKINNFVQEFGSQGFRSGALYRNQEWFSEFRFSYDMSVPNSAHLDPQHGGCCTFMPYFVGSLLEIPVTMTQDYTLFHVLEQYSLDLWHEQLDIIMKQHGLASFIVHPDYIQTSRPMGIYRELLAYLSYLRQQKGLWLALPGEVNIWWRQRNNMHLVWNDDCWQIEGQGAERARIAYARIEDNYLTYRIA